MRVFPVYSEDPSPLDTTRHCVAPTAPHIQALAMPRTLPQSSHLGQLQMSFNETPRLLGARPLALLPPSWRMPLACASRGHERGRSCHGRIPAARFPRAAARMSWRFPVTPIVY